MEKAERLELETIAAQLRRDALEMVQTVQSGHLGGSLSALDILTVLYFKEMHVDPSNPRDPDRDRFVLSKGHATPALYPTLARKGFFPKKDLATFRHIDSYLSGHAEMTKVPGVDMSEGSLGQGLSAALGMALAAKLDGRNYRVYCLCGDGEIQEGQIWEAAQTAGHLRPENLTVFIDNNRIQLDGFTADINGPSDTVAKFRAFGWNAFEINGHDVEQIANAVEQAKEFETGPTAIIANTVKSKGVPFMENDPQWHGATPNAEQFAEAFEAVDSTLANLELIKNGEEL